MKGLRALLCNEPSSGGCGRHVLDLASGLKAAGHSVTLVYSSGRSDPGFGAAARRCCDAAIELPMRREVGPGDVAAARGLSRLMRNLGPFDVVHGHSSKAGALLRLIPGRAARVYTPHAFRTMDPTAGWASRAVFGAVEAGLAKLRSDAVIAVSQAEYEHALVLGVPQRKLHLVPNGVTSVPAASAAETRRRFGVPDDHLMIGFVGRLTSQKAPERFVDLFARLAAENGELTGLMFGDGALRDAIRSRIQARGLGERLRLICGQDARPYIAAFDVLVMTSRYEGFPYVLLEAAVAGVPTVTTDVGGAKEAVRHGETGFICPVERTDLALFAASRMLLENREMRAGFSRAALSYAHRHSSEVMVAATERVYAEACAVAGLADREQLKRAAA